MTATQTRESGQEDLAYHRFQVYTIVLTCQVGEFAKNSSTRAMQVPERVTQEFL